MITLKKILVPIDFSEGAELSTKYAASMAAEYGSQIHLLHVIEEEALHPGNLDDPLNTKEKWEKEGMKRLDEFAPPSLKDFDVIKTVRGGPVYETILDYAT